MSQADHEIGAVVYDLISDTPIDHLWVAAADCGLVAINFRGSESDFQQKVQKLCGQTPLRSASTMQPYISALQGYFSQRQALTDLPICWSVMTDFQQQTLKLVWAIPLGQVRTYGDIADELQNPKAIRAVGRANATNPIPLVVPCHRVIGADGALRGFGGGVATKAWLLKHEGFFML